MVTRRQLGAVQHRSSARRGDQQPARAGSAVGQLGAERDGSTARSGALLSIYRRWRARRIWVSDSERALALLQGLIDAGHADPQSFALAAWLTLTTERDARTSERLAREALGGEGDIRFAWAALAEVMQRDGRDGEAADVLREARARRPEIKWYALSLADALESAGEIDAARELLECSAADPQLRRHCVKRLSRLALVDGDREQALHWYGELIGLAPDYLVYASDYATLGRLQLEAGDRDAARETWRKGARIYARNQELRELRAEHFDEHEPLAEARIAPVAEQQVGAHRIPVRTPMITARTGLLPLLEEATRPQRRPGDVVALSESAAAAGQGRLIPLELISPVPIARLLSRYVGKLGPLHSPEGMQAAILQAGRVRVLAGASASVIGKLLGHRGWFYRVAGLATALIDDVAAALPPHDHHIVFGPDKPDRLATELAKTLGNEVAIVDANHISGAWVVGASTGVNRRWVERVLADNPAGNEDEQTPVVLIRRLGTEGERRQ